MNTEQIYMYVQSNYVVQRIEHWAFVRNKKVVYSCMQSVIEKLNKHIYFSFELSYVKLPNDIVVTVPSQSDDIRKLRMGWFLWKEDFTYRRDRI